MNDKENYAECLLGSVVSPGEFWLVSKLESHVNEVRHAEKTLSHELQKILSIPSSDSLEIHKCVAVENPSLRGVWNRGIIVQKLHGDNYEVFWIDYGYFSVVSRKNLQINRIEDCIQVEPLAFKLCLYDLVPCSSAESESLVSGHWSQAARDCVSDLFSKKILIYVKKYHIIDRTVFGDIYFLDKPNGQLMSLAKLLIHKRHAVYSESQNDVKAVRNESSKCSKNNSDDGSLFQNHLLVNASVKKVKDWQLANLDFQQTNAISPSPECRETSEGKSSEENEERSPLECRTAEDQTIKNGQIKNPPLANLPKKQEDRGKFELSRKFTFNRSEGFVLKKQTPNETPQRRRYNRDKRTAFHLDTDDLVGSTNVGKDIFRLNIDPTVRPRRGFRDLNIKQDIILNLERGDFNRLSQIQKWVIPTILKRQSVTVIGAAKTGKSLSYIIPIVELLQAKLYLGEDAIGSGPLAIIVCSGSKSCQFIYKAFKVLTSVRGGAANSEGKLRVEVVHGNGKENDAWVRLTNGCHVLISTPHCLVRLLKGKVIRTLEMLNFLVLDDANVITQEPFLPALKVICNEAKYSTYCQRIICGEKWTSEIESLINTYAKNCGLLISSYLEVAAYLKLKPILVFIDNKSKPEALLDIVKKKFNHHKMLIVCEVTYDVLLLKKMFETNGFNPQIAYSGTKKEDIKELKRRWSLKEKIVICTDDVISLLDVDDVEVLVHYNLPRDSKTNFGYRFSTITMNHRNCDQEHGNQNLASVIIFLDDTSHYQLAHVVDFVKHLGGKVPEEILDISNKMVRCIEISKSNAPICWGLLEFNKCGRGVKCSRRHAFIKEIDSPPSVLNGYLKFKILHVHSPSHLSVAVTCVIDHEKRKRNFDDLRDSISEKMKSYYENEENRRSHGQIVVGSICGARLNSNGSDQFLRARIVECIKFNKYNQPTAVVVRFMDVGNIGHLPVCQLYELPEDLMEQPAQAWDVYLCNLLPNDFDSDWSEQAISYAKEIFCKKLEPDQYWAGKIQLCLKESFHLDPVKLCSTLETINTNIIDFCPRSLLLSNGIAVKNDLHLQKLFSLCKDAGMDVSSAPCEKESLPMQNVDIRWAFFGEDTVKVQLVSIESLSALFLRHSKFKSVLKDLENDCRKEGYQLKSKKVDKDIEENLKVGSYCLALCGDVWCRVRIESLSDGHAFVYCVDYGRYSTVEEVLPISDKLLNQLPAQAIECSLLGVKGETVPMKKVLEEINEFTKDGKNDIYARVTNKNLKPDVTGGHKYKIILFNIEGYCLNRNLIDSGLVEAEETELKFSSGVDPFESGWEDVKKVLDENLDYNELTAGVENEKEFTNNSSDSFINLDPDMFEDESARNMIQEFSEQVLMPNIKNKELLSTEFSESSNEAQLNTSRNNIKTDETDDRNKYEMTPKQSDNNSAWMVSAGGGAFPEIDTNVHTPQVLWGQNTTEIQIKVMLTNAKTYRMDCSFSSVIFKCALEGKVYVSSLRFFGYVIPELTAVRVKTFFVAIIFKKMFPSPWPRLTWDNFRFGWIKRDADYCRDVQNSLLDDVAGEAALPEDCSSEKKDRSRTYDESLLVHSTDDEEDSLSLTDDEESED